MICLHCKEPCVSITDSFCCKGCEVAHSIISKFDLGKYYEYCKNIYDKRPMKVEQIENQLEYLEYVSAEDKENRINLLVEGIHCGSCVWLIESTLRKQEGVTLAHVNLSTRRLVLKWKGKKSDVELLVKVVQDLGYKLIPFEVDVVEIENKKKEVELIKAIAVSGVATLSIMMLVMGIWAGNSDNSLGVGTRELLHWIAGLIAVPAILYSGQHFFRSAYQALNANRTNMDVPISLGIIAATLLSIQQTLLSSQYTYYDAAVSLIFFLLIGRYLDIKARNKARERAQNMVLSQAKSITLIDDGKMKLVPIKRAVAGDIAFVAVGEKIAADGIIIEGSSEVDNSLITGETIPTAVKVGDFVNAGTLNLNTPLKIRITKVGENTTLAEIIKLVETAEQGRANYSRIADRVASVYTPVVLLLSWVTLMLWMYFGSDLSTGIESAVAVLIVTCPCALGLAVPVVQVIATSRLMSKGVLVKSADALEKLSEIDSVVLDKTGTLTMGKPAWVNREDFTDDEIKIVCSIASHSKHPLSLAITKGFNDKPLKIEVDELKGQGLACRYKSYNIKLGSRKFCEVTDDAKDDHLELWFKFGAKKLKRLIFKDELKADAKDMIKWMGKKMFQTYLLSGDRKFVVARVASKLGISNFKSEVTPKEKYKYLDDLAKVGHKVLMVGDGLNDAAALKKAHVSMSPSTAIDVAQTNADIVFQGEKLLPVKEAYETAKIASKLIMQNFVISFAYNAITIPLAMLGYLNPIIAAIVMSASSLMVVGNSMRLNIRK